MLCVYNKWLSIYLLNYSDDDRDQCIYWPSWNDHQEFLDEHCPIQASTANKKKPIKKSNEDSMQRFINNRRLNDRVDVLINKCHQRSHISSPTVWFIK